MSERVCHRCGDDRDMLYTDYLGQLYCRDNDACISRAAAQALQRAHAAGVAEERARWLEVVREMERKGQEWISRLNAEEYEFDLYCQTAFSVGENFGRSKAMRDEARSLLATCNAAPPATDAATTEGKE